METAVEPLLMKLWKTSLSLQKAKEEITIWKSTEEENGTTYGEAHRETKL